MRTLKLLISGALLILLGPIMHALDVMFAGFHLVCWIVGIPLFLAGLVMPEKGTSISGQSEDLPQKICPECGKTHDFDYPKCPYCGHDYQKEGIH